MNTPATDFTGQSNIIAVDFFCGAGGTTHGFLSAGIDVVCGIDHDKTLQQTYEFNNVRLGGTNCKFICSDIDDVTEATLRDEIGDRADKSLVFIGCAPCQPFTQLNTDKAKQGNTKNLLLSFYKHVERFKPEYILVENVPGIQNQKYSDIFQTFTRGLASLGYRMDCKVIDAKKYGVPQTRRRTALLASLLAPSHCLPKPMAKVKSPMCLLRMPFAFQN